LAVCGIVAAGAADSVSSWILVVTTFAYPRHWFTWHRSFFGFGQPLYDRISGTIATFVAQ